MASKIEKYALEGRVLELRGQGHTTNDIARIVSGELLGNDTISHQSVCRFLRQMTQARREETRQTVENHIKGVLPGDLEALEKMEKNLLGWHEDLALPKPERARYAMDALKIIDTKLRYSGILEDSSQAAGISHPVDLSEYKMDPDSKEDDEIRTH